MIEKPKSFANFAEDEAAKAPILLDMV